MIGIGLAGAAILALAGPAAAFDELVDARGWQQVDYAENGACRAEVRGNGQFYRIAGEGVRPGEVVRFYLQNEGVKPIEYSRTANGDGAWREFYIPFVWHRDGGTVRVTLASESCTLDLSFEWARRRA
jgi:hypothetical protein